MVKIIYFIITFFVGMVAKYFYDQFKNKVQKIQYSVNKTFMGVSADDKKFGKIEIFHNGTQVENLYLCDIDLINTTNKDFENIQIKVWCGSDNTILYSYAGKASSPDIFKFTTRIYG